MLPYVDDVELCQAQYCEPKPEALLPCAVATTYCTVALVWAAVLPKCPAARMASPARSDWLGRDGAALGSCQTPARMPLGFPACAPLAPQVIVPVATPWQYCVTEFSQLLPPTEPRNPCKMPSSPDGSLPVHCDPHSTR